MAKRIYFPGSMTIVRDHEPYWEHGDIVKASLHADGEAKVIVELHVSHIGQSTAGDIGKYRMWYNPSSREMTIDNRVYPMHWFHLENTSIVVEDVYEKCSSK